MVLKHPPRMTTRLTTILLAFLATLSSLSASVAANDAAIKKQLVGSWKGPDGQTIILKEDGVITDSDNEPGSKERWDMKDNLGHHRRGVLHTFFEDGETGETTRNNFFKIISLSETKLVIQDLYHGRGTGTWTRSAASNEAAQAERASPTQTQRGEITDGNSLQSNLRLYRRYADGAKLNAVDIITVFTTVGYMKGYVGGCYPWAELDKTGCPYALPRMPLTQLMQVVDKYLADHPEELHQSAESLVFAAITNSFPNPQFKKRND
jgi:hypothetical protein